MNGTDLGIVHQEYSEGNHIILNIRQQCRVETVLTYLYDRVDQAIDLHKEKIGMGVIAEDNGTIRSFISGLFYEKEGWPFFVTAGHISDNIEIASDRRKMALVLRGRKGVIPLNMLDLIIFDTLDLAICPLWKLPSTSHLNYDCFKDEHVNKRDSFDRGIFSFCGFPESINETWKGREIKPAMRIIHLGDLVNKDIQFNHFDFNPSKCYGRDFQKIKMSVPIGMSGGPVFLTENPISPYPLLIGIGLTCYPATSPAYLKCLNFEWIDAIITNYLMRGFRY